MKQRPLGLLGWFFQAVLSVVLLACPSLAVAQSVSVAKWTFGTSSYTTGTNSKHTAVTNSPTFITSSVSGFAVTQRGTSSDRFPQLGSWTSTENSALQLTRSSYNPISNTKVFYSTLTLSNQANGDWSNLKFNVDYQRTAAASPKRARAFLTWQEGSAWKTAYSDLATLSTSTGSWVTQTFSFTNGSALPTVLAAEQFLLEIQFSNVSSSSNNIYVDNLELLCDNLNASWTVAPATLASWPVNKPFSAQFSVPSYSGATTWSSSGSLPAGLSFNTSNGILSGTPTNVGSSAFTITASGAGASRSYTLAITAAASTPPATSTLARWNFDGDTTANGVKAPELVGSAVTEVSWGFVDSGSNLNFGLTQAGSSSASATPISSVTNGKMRNFSGWDKANNYTTTRNGLLHFDNDATATTTFAVFPTANTSSIPNASRTSTGMGKVIQARLKMHANATGDLEAFYFDALRWQRDLMSSDGANGPRYAELHAYWLNDSNVLQRWDSGSLDLNAVYYPEYRGSNQFRRFWFNLDANTSTGLSARIKATTTQYRNRTVFFDLYFFHESTADTSDTANPASILIDEMGITGDFTMPTTDYGDYSGFASASSTANTNLRLGALIDAETTASVNATATGDDTNGIDDEDGVTIEPLAAGQYATVTVNVTNTSGAVAYLSGWIDYNRNGNVLDVGEQIINNVTIANGTNNSTLTYNITVPINASQGASAARFRLTSTSNPGPSGASGHGEVEDYGVTLLPPQAADFAVVVVNYNNNTISRFNGTNGAHLATFSPSGLNSPNYGYRLGDNTLLVANGNGNTITKHNPFTGALISTLVTNNRGLNFPYQMAIGQDGLVYIANQNADNILRFNGQTGAMGGTVASLTNPAGLVFDSDGFLYVTQNQGGGSLRMYNTSGVLQSTIITFPSSESPRGLAWGPDGRLYVNVKTSAGGRVDAIAFPARSKSTFVTLDSGSAPYTGIKWGPDGNLYVVDYGEDELHVFTPSGAALRTMTTSLSGPHAVAFTDLTANASDFGDYSGFGSASSVRNGNLKLGNEVDPEAASRNTDTANGDDIDDLDDEDGITLPASFVRGDVSTITVKVTNNSGAPAYLNAWMDFNKNGLLSDAGEKIINNITIPNGTNNATQTYNITVPGTAIVGDVGLRFRLTSTSNPDSLGASGIGEVEDYVAPIQAAPADYGDYAGAELAWSNITSLLKMGQYVDADPSTIANGNATGDDLDQSPDDEDGVTIPAVLYAGLEQTINVQLTNGTGAPAYLNAWMDFNYDGDFDDAGERVINNYTVVTGSNAVNTAFKILVADGAVSGVPVGARFRLSSVSNPASTGAAGNGEVEDYAVTITRPECNLAGQTVPDFRTPTRETSTTGIGWISAPRPGTLSQTFMSWRETGVNATFNYSNNMWDASAPNIFTDTATPSNAVHCNPAYKGSLRFTNNTASTAAGTPGNADGASRMEIVFSQPVWLDSIRLGNLARVGSAWAWTRTTAYGTDGAIVPTSAFTAGGSNCSGGASPSVALVMDDGVGGKYAVGVDNQSSNFSNEVSYSYTRAAITRLVIDHWAGTSANNPSAAHSTQSTAIAITSLCFVPATPRMGVGNMVFSDTNLNGRYDAGEGVSGVQVRLFREGDTPSSSLPVAINTTNSNGVYGFGGLVGGNYFVHVPASEFATGKALNGLLSLPGTKAGDDNTGEDGLDAATPASSGISSAVFNLANNDEPINTTTETGAFNTSDDADDDNTDLTVDFGFMTPSDFGDLADTNINTSAGNYQTLGIYGGPYHKIIPNLRLGATIDADLDGMPSANATGDDLTGIDDEDAILSMPSFVAGLTTTLPVVVHNTAGVMAYLNVWVDLNNNGSFEDAGEKLATVNVATGTSGTLNVPLIIPSTAVTSSNLGLRLRLSQNSSLTSLGSTPAGEVEDYLVTIASPSDWGDSSLLGSASSMTNSNLRMGTATTDAEDGSLTDADAMSDDANGDDEDGVTFAAIIPGQSTSVAVRLTNLSGATAYLSAWFDFNGNGILEASEKVITDTIATGTNNVTRNYAVNVPAITPEGLLTARFRLTSVSGAAATGAAGSGEVEDHTATVSAPNMDFGDASSLPDAWSRASTNLRLGTSVDTEAVSTRNADATGDDITGNDDEDGVNAWPQLIAGSTVNVSLRARNATGAAAYLNVWADWNGDGDVLDSGEQIITNQTVANSFDGTLSLPFSIPAAAGAGTYIVRFRITDVATPGNSGYANLGEVEDYQVTTTCPAVVIAQTQLPSPTVNVTYSQTLTATGGASPKTWSVASGSLPGGLSLNATTGILSGNPTGPGTFSFAIRSTDPYGCSGSQSFSLTVSSLALGNIIWSDTNNNGIRNNGEPGVSGATVQLFSPGADNAIGGTGANADTQVGGTITTNSTGAYSFVSLSQGKYYVKVTPPASHPKTSGIPVTLDNGVNDDNNGSQPDGPGTPLFSPIIDLTTGSEPTNDGDSDANTDLTVDFGLFPGFTVGNMVWNDANNNGVRDNGEAGIPGLTVQLLSTGADNSIGGSDADADTIVATTTTSGTGSYTLATLIPGTYYVRVTPSNAFPAVSSITTNLDNGVDDDNNGSQGGEEYAPIQSMVFTLEAGREPGSSGTGNAENTIDFGLRPSTKCSVGNLVFMDNNNNGRFDAGDTALGGVRVQLFNTNHTLIAQTTTTGDATQPGFAIQQAQSTTPLGNVDQADLCLQGINRSSNYVGTAPVINHFGNGSDYGLFGGGSLFPAGSMDNMAFRAVGTITIPTSGFYTFAINTDDGGRVRIDGNTVLLDHGPHAPQTALASTYLAAGPHLIEFVGYEAGGGECFELLASPGVYTSISGTDVGQFGTFRLIGDTANGGLPVTCPAPSNETGRYRFNNVVPGTYYVKIPASEFSAAGPLFGRLSYAQSIPPTDDQRDDNSLTGSSDSGIDDLNPVANGIRSHDVTLALGTEPTTATGETGFLFDEDDGADSNVDLTVDFAFNGTSQTLIGCYHFRVSDVARDGNALQAVTDWSPDQPWDLGYLSNGVSYLDNLDLTYDADNDSLSFDGTFGNIGGRKSDSFWLRLSTGPNANSDDVAILYFDGHNRASPKITVYKHSANSAELSWQNSSNIMVSTAGEGINASDVRQISAVEDASGVRFRFTLSLSQIGKAANWTAMGVNPVTWTGMRFAGRAGISLRWMDANSAPAYDASGRLTSFDMGGANQGWLTTDSGGNRAIYTEQCPTVGIGNLAFQDTNNNGVRDEGEPGIDDLVVQLWKPGANGLRQNGGGDDILVTTGLTSNGGEYSFTGLDPGIYYVRIPVAPPTHPVVGGTPDTSDNGEDNDNNGEQPGGSGNPVLSPLISLAVGQEPGQNGGGNADNTIDFGFASCPTITVVTANLLVPTVGTPYTQSLAANGSALGAYTWNLASGNLPAGLSLSPGGVISGTPTNVDSASFTLRAMDARGCAGTRLYTITPQCPVLALSPTSLSSGSVGSNFNQTITGSGGTAPYSYSVTSGTLPSGLTLNVNNGNISGTPTVSNGAGVSVTLRVQDAYGCATTRNYTFKICPIISVGPTILLTPTVGSTYSQTVTGGSGIYVYSVASGALPAGLNLNTSSGVLSGTPTSASAATFTVQATDPNGCVGTRQYTVTPVCPAITLNPVTLGVATANQAYTQSVVATGGTAPYSYAISGGTLPSGLILSPGGLFNGTPTTGNGAGVAVTIRATDANGCSSTRAYTLQVCPVPVLTPTSLVAPTVGTSYNRSVTASSGVQPYTYSIASGTLPAGLTINSSNGTITGIPTSTTTATFTVRAVDANGCPGTQNYTLTPVCPSITVSPDTWTSATVGTPYSQTVTATGGSAPYTFSISSGSLPAGLIINNTSGVVSGTPTSNATATFTVKATDQYGCEGTRAYNFTPVCPTITVTPNTLPDAVFGVNYTQTITASGGISPYTFNVSSGTLPAGLILNASSGSLSGTPTTTIPAGTSITIQATDANGCRGTLTYTLKVCPVITINTSLPAPIVGTSYTQTFGASGGQGTYVFSLASGSLPTGLSFGSNGLSGTATNTNSANFVIRVTDGNGCVATRSYSLTPVCPTLTLNPATPADAVQGIAYNQTITTSGGTAPFTYSVLSGTLPAGLNLDGTSGIISGTPTTMNGAGVSVTLRVTDTYGCSGSRTLNFKVCPVITINPVSLNTPTVGSPFNQPLSVIGGTTPHVYTVASGTLPAGMALDTETNAITGTPTSSASATFTIRCTDAYGCVGTRQYTVTPVCPALTLGPITLPAATTGSAYSQAFNTSGGTAPYSYTITSGSLPAGLTLQSGAITGTPSTSNGLGTSITVRATDTYGCTGTRTYTIQVCPVLTINPTSLTPPTVGFEYSQSVTGSGGAAPYTFTIASGNLPAGLILAGSGALSGVTGSTQTGSFTVRMTDANGCQATRIYNLTPVCPTISLLPATPARASVGSSYSETFSASGGVGPYTFAVSNGTLPNGLTLNPNSGSLSGIPNTANGSGVSVTIQATDSNGCQGSRVLTLIVCPTITVSPETLGTPTLGHSFSATITSSGGASPYLYSVSTGSLPSGLVLNPNTGVISGSATSTTTAQFVIRSTDANGCIGSRSYTVTPVCPVIGITPANPPMMHRNASSSITFSATNGLAPYSWTVASGSVPEGMALSPSGVLSGIPTVPGSTTFSVRATDANGCASIQSVTTSVTGMSIGNLVWQDNNRNGLRDAGETGAAGAIVQLFRPGADNSIGGSGANADTQVGSSLTTDATGAYTFVNLDPGNYYVKVTLPPHFTHTGGAVVYTDNNVDNDNNGAQPGGPNTPLFSPIISLQPGTESVIDGDTDNDTNLTVDFGVWASMSVGNVVFFDYTGNGAHNLIEGLDRVLVQIFREGENPSSATPSGADITDSKGRYQIDNLNPGRYFLHIPASQFEFYMPLQDCIPMSNVVPGDDDVGQDALFTMVPSSSGVSTAVFNLYVGQAPQGSDESGFDGFSDDARDARCDLTRDFGFVAMSGSGFPMTMRARQTLEPAPITTAQTEPTTGDAESPSAPAATLTFARWQQDHAQLSDLSASGNPDADLLDNLLEYALGTLPDSGTSGSGNFHLAVSPAGEVEALYSRPNDGRMDIRYLLEGSTDGQSWFALPLAPVTSFDSNGTQVRRYSGLEAQSAFAGHSRGMVRLTVNLDANLDGTPEATSASPTLAWSRETFGVGTRTFSMPLVTPELFAGKLHGIENNAILRIQAQGLAAKVVEGTAHYADILTGPHSGHRLHLKSITDTTLQVATEHDQTTLKVLPASLVNEQIAIRSYWKLDTLLPGDLFGSSDAGDRVMFMDRTSRQFVLYHLETSSDGSRVWRNQENNAEQRVVSPSEALMVQVRHTEATVLLMGQVLPALPVYPIEAGTQFLAMPGWADQNLPDTHGLTSAGTATEATRLRLWKPDFETVTSGYAQYYLQRDGTANRWTAEGQKGTDLTTPTIPAFRGVFLISPTAHPNWKWQ